MDLQGALETVLRTNESQLRPQREGKDCTGKHISSCGRTCFRLMCVCCSRALHEPYFSAAAAVSPSRLNSLEDIEPAPPQRHVSFPLNARDWVKDKLTPARTEDADEEAVPPPQMMEFPNGLGGFTADGNEYVTILKEEQWTPAPWINVIANPSFGFQVSVEGAGYTWSMNSRENQLTPWSNDPVGDKPGEVIYIRDEHSGELWIPDCTPDQGRSRPIHCTAWPGLQPL